MTSMQWILPHKRNPEIRSEKLSKSSNNIIQSNIWQIPRTYQKKSEKTRATHKNSWIKTERNSHSAKKIKKKRRQRESERQSLGLLKGASVAEVEEIVDPISIDPNRAVRRRIVGVPIRIGNGGSILRLRLLHWNGWNYQLPAPTLAAGVFLWVFLGSVVLTPCAYSASYFFATFVSFYGESQGFFFFFQQIRMGYKNSKLQQ